MGAMKHYFNYSMRGGCGIPQITLEGSIDDWQEIRRRVEKFQEYGLEEWAIVLEPILDQFVLAS